MKQAFH